MLQLSGEVQRKPMDGGPIDIKKGRCVKVACGATDLTPTNFTSGCCTASQIARASVASILLPLTNGRTTLACISRTEWPRARNSRAQ